MIPYIIIGLLLVAYLLRCVKNHSLNLPPGPRGVPILGNLMDVGQKKWIRFAEWRERYGPVLSLNILSHTFIVINTEEAAYELLDKRSKIYSDRPRLIMSNEILCGSKAMPLLPYGNKWRLQRRVAHIALSAPGCRKYHSMQQEEAMYLVADLVGDPHAWHAHAQRSMYSMLLRLIYGVQHTSSIDDPFLAKILIVTQQIILAISPINQVIDLLPVLDYLPDWIARWRRSGRKSHDRADELIVGMFRESKSNFSSVGSPSCFSEVVHQHIVTGEISEQEGAWLSAMTFGGGSDTTGAVLQVFFLAMCCYPGILRKAQASIDTVIDRTRLPDFNDRDRLIYIEALIKELLRWRPIGPLALPHAVMEDDVYNGYDIPKGSIILANIWGISLDPNVYDSPHEFIPERFLSNDDSLITDGCSLKERIHAFGYGRRLCPGISIAYDYLYISIVTILWALDIEAPSKPDPNGFIDEGLVFRPPNFRCTFQYRDQAACDLISL